MSMRRVTDKPLISKHQKSRFEYANKVKIGNKVTAMGHAVPGLKSPTSSA